VTATANSWVKNVNYAYDYAGAPSGVGTNILQGAADDNTTNLMSNFLYRGFGGLKRADYGNGRRLNLEYGVKRQQLSRLLLNRANDANDKLLDLNYDYSNGGANNGRIQKVADALNRIEPRRRLGGGPR
jgi:hypothetical protein